MSEQDRFLEAFEQLTTKMPSTDAELDAALVAIRESDNPALGPIQIGIDGIENGLREQREREREAAPAVPQLIATEGATVELIKAIAATPRVGWAGGRPAIELAVWNLLNGWEYGPPDENRKAGRRVVCAKLKQAQRAVDDIASAWRSLVEDTAFRMVGLLSMPATWIFLTPEDSDVGGEAAAQRRALSDLLATLVAMWEATPSGIGWWTSNGGAPPEPLRSALASPDVTQRAIARAVMASDLDWSLPPCPNLVEWFECRAKVEDDVSALLERRISEWLR